MDRRNRAYLNKIDFPAQALTPLGIKAVTPDEFYVIFGIFNLKFYLGEEKVLRFSPVACREGLQGRGSLSVPGA
ncbi:MAG TPA: hypothetical protein DD643_02775 [Synechococcus sp. UBA8638]|nr:hypothetical protein [Synechococcus sp. UBA8638]